MSKIKLIPPKLLEHLEGETPSLFSTPSEAWSDIQRYRSLKLLSDTPKGLTPYEFPYQIAKNKVLLHDIFTPLFPEGIPLMEQSMADRLLSYDIGYNSKTDMPVRIHRNDNGNINKIIGYSQTNEAFLIDIKTAEIIKIGDNK